MKTELEPDLSSKTDSELLVVIGRKTDGQAFVREAWAELYRRHASYLYQVCCRAAEALGRSRSQFAEETVCDVFRHVFEHAAERFEPKHVGHSDGERKHVRAWLGTVATRVVKTAIRRRAQRSEFCAEHEYLEQLTDEGPRERSNPEIQKSVRQCLSRVLTDEERQVVAEKMQWWPSRMPPDVLEDLAARLGKSKAAIQKIYQRSLNKVEEALKNEGIAPTKKGIL